VCVCVLQCSGDDGDATASSLRYVVLVKKRTVKKVYFTEIVNTG